MTVQRGRPKGRGWHEGPIINITNTEVTRLCHDDDDDNTAHIVFIVRGFLSSAIDRFS